MLANYFLKVDEEGNLMLVPQQCALAYCNDGEFIEDEDLIPLIVGSAALAVVLIVIICIICAVCIKKNKRDEKLRHLLSPNAGRETLTPAYRPMAYTSNMEGTAMSLDQYRRGPTTATSSPMMPLPAAYVRCFLRDD
jgi:hypothetical protein